MYILRDAKITLKEILNIFLVCVTLLLQSPLNYYEKQAPIAVKRLKRTSFSLEANSNVRLVFGLKEFLVTILSFPWHPLVCIFKFWANKSSFVPRIRFIYTCTPESSPLSTTENNHHPFEGSQYFKCQKSIPLFPVLIQGWGSKSASKEISISARTFVIPTIFEPVPKNKDITFSIFSQNFKFISGLKTWGVHIVTRDT